jgi:SAM-dependent methyltransferase
MTTREAVGLIGGAVGGRGGTWADFGASRGTFTRALVELLGPGGRIYAVDQDARAMAALARWAAGHAANVIPVAADFTAPLHLPGLDGAMLDAMLLANALHFVPDPDRVLARLAGWLRPGGRAVLVEYDRGRGNRWVPHPIPAARWPSLAAAAGLAAPIVAGTRPSAFGGNLYVAAAERPAGS